MAKSGNSIDAEATNTELMEQLLAMEIAPYLGDARMTVDDPDKLLNEIHQVVATEVAKALAGVELWEARADAAKITAPDGARPLIPNLAPVSWPGKQIQNSRCT